MHIGQAIPKYLGNRVQWQKDDTLPSSQVNKTRLNNGNTAANEPSYIEPQGMQQSWNLGEASA
jgi:hypothetical protein